MSLPGDSYQSVLGSGPRAAERESQAEATRAEARASGMMPRYLCGGQEVPGLGPVLGAALCFLYVHTRGAGGVLVPGLVTWAAELTDWRDSRARVSGTRHDTACSRMR